MNLYQISRGRPSHDEATTFLARGDEIKLASISFEVRGTSDTFRADFWLVRGRMFSITFSKSPKGLRASDVRIRNVQVFIDPMRPSEGAAWRRIDQQGLTGWLREWAGRWRLGNLREPLPADERAERIRQVGTPLPDEYLELVAQTEGLDIDGCVIHGLSEIRQIVMPDGNYWVLAELRDKGVFAVREEAGNPEIVFLGYENERPLRLRTSFRSAIEGHLHRP